MITGEEEEEKSIGSPTLEDPPLLEPPEPDHLELKEALPLEDEFVPTPIQEVILMIMYEEFELEMEMNEEEILEILEIEVPEIKSSRTNVDSPQK